MPFDPIFAGFLQPPDVPEDPTGADWRGIPGPPGPTGPPGTGGGAFLPLIGGTLTGPLTVTNTTTSGIATIGTASANYVHVSGGPGNVTIQVVGASTNSALNLKGKGISGVTMQTGNGTVLFVSDDATGAVGNALTILGGATTTPTRITSASPAGINFNGPIQNNRVNVSRAGLWNAAGTNYQGLRYSMSMLGYSLDAGSWPFHYLNASDTVKSTAGAVGLQQLNTYGAGHSGPRTGIWSTSNTVGPPYIPQPWQATHAYVLGDLVTNGGIAPPGNIQNVYRCIGAGTSAASGGPTGGASSIVDGTATWAYGRTFPTQFYYVGGVWTMAAGYNCGGTEPTSSLTAGSVFGGNASGRLNTGATNFTQCVGLEIDNMIAAGASASVNVGLQIAHVEDHAVQGTEIDVCLRLADQNVPGGAWRNLISLGDYASKWPVDPNGYLVQVQNNDIVASTAAGGIDFNQLLVAGSGPEGGNFYWRSPGVKIRDTELVAGYLSIGADANGAVLDATYSQMTAAAGAITVASSSADWNNGDRAVDQYGNTVIVNASPTESGTVTSVRTVLTRGWQTTPPTNPVTFRSRTRTGRFFGTSLTLNLAWTAKNRITMGSATTDVAVSGKFGANGATPVARAVITGERSAATVSVLTQVLALLDAAGLATNSTTNIVQDFKTSNQFALATSGSGIATPAGSDDTTNNSLNSRMPCLAPMLSAIQDIVLSYPGWAMIPQEADYPSAYTVTAAIEYPVGTFWPCYVNGSRTLTVPISHTESRFDPVAITIPAGATFYVKSWVTWTVGHFYLSPSLACATLATSWTKRGTDVADLTLDATTQTGTSSSFGFGPHVFGTLATPCATLGILGDSLVPAGGFPDPVLLGSEHGWPVEAMLGKLPAVNLASSGSGITQSMLRQEGRQYVLRQSCTHILYGFIHNDMNNGGKTLAEAQALLRAGTAIYLNRGQKVFPVTCTHAGTSTNGFIDQINQGPLDAGINAQRIAFNNWLLANWQSEGFAGVFDWAHVTDPGDVGKWPSTGSAVVNVARGNPTMSGRAIASVTVCVYQGQTARGSGYPVSTTVPAFVIPYPDDTGTHGGVVTAQTDSGGFVTGFTVVSGGDYSMRPMICATGSYTTDGVHLTTLGRMQMIAQTGLRPGLFTL